MKRAALGICVVAAVVALVVWWRSSGETRVREAIASEVHGSRATVPEIDAPPVSVAGRVVERTGTGIAGAIVAFTPIGGRGPHDPEAVVTAGKDGAWKTVVAPGRYAVTASAAGFVPLARVVEVGAAPIELVLDRGGAVVRGTIEDASGGPIAGARVELFERMTGMPLGVAQSDAAGRYVVAAPIGWSIAVAHAEGYARAERAIDVERGVVAVAADFRLVAGAAVRGVVVDRDGAPCPEPLVVARGKRQSWTAVGDGTGRFALDGLEPGEVELNASGEGCATEDGAHVEVGYAASVDDVRLVAERAYAVSGVVVARESQQPLAGMRVALLRGHVFPVRGATAVTDDAGRFRVAGVPRGKFAVEADGEGRLIEFGPDVTVEGDATVKIEMSAGRTIRGRVEPAALADLAFDLTSMDRRDAGSRRATAVHGVTDATGAFELRNVPDGDYTLAAYAGDGRRGKLKLPASGDVEGARIALAPPGDAALDGTVVDEDGAPVGDLVVELFSASDWLHPRHTTTAADGSFAFENVPRGKTTIGLRDRELLGDDKLELAAGVRHERLVVRAEDGAIRGHVDGIDGAPARDVWVSAVTGRDDASPVATAVTDASGNFALARLRRGAYTVVAQSAGGDDRARVPDVETGRTVALRLVRPDRLVVRVIAGGVPVRSFDLSCTLEHGSFSTTVVRTDGTYRSEPLAPQSATCSVAGRGGAAVGTTAIPQPLELTLAAYGTVSGTIVDAAGKPVAHRRASYLAGDAAPEDDPFGGASDLMRHGVPFETDDAGRFTVEHALAGPGWIVVRTGDKVLATVRFSVGSGARVELPRLALP